MPISGCNWATCRAHRAKRILSSTAFDELFRLSGPHGSCGLPNRSLNARGGDGSAERRKRTSGDRGGRCFGDAAWGRREQEGAGKSCACPFLRCVYSFFPCRPLERPLSARLCSSFEARRLHLLSSSTFKPLALFRAEPLLARFRLRTLLVDSAHCSECVSRRDYRLCI
ncbi:hypothetical protein MRX96_015953 [Rhipicephalus microplus]